MRQHTLHYWLLKAARLSGWLLLPLIVLYLVTGFALCGEFGVTRLISAQTSLKIHQAFEWPLVAIFAAHASLTIYFALRRWGWIRNRPCPEDQANATAAERPVSRGDGS